MSFFAGNDPLPGDRAMGDRIAHLIIARTSDPGGFEMRPHPHIGLPTITCLFADQMAHKDSLGTAMVIRPGDLNLMLFGGDAVGSHRHIWWNFVSFSKGRIEQARQEWKTGRFDIMPGDEQACIPLPG